MKNMKIKGLLLASALATTAFAGTATNNITASVTVASTLSVAATQNMTLGTILQSGSSTVSVPAACPSVAPANTGIFSVSGAAGGEGTTMAMAYDANLVDASANTIAFSTPSAGYCATGDDTTAPTSVDTIGTAVTLVADGAATNQVFVGGTVTASAGQTPGVYTGSITLTVTY